MFKSIFYLSVIVLSLGFDFLYVKPAYSTMVDHQAGLSNLENSRKSTDEIRDLINHTKQSMSTIKPEDIARLDVLLPQTMDDVRLANNLQAMGVAAGIMLTDIKIADKTAPTGVGATTASQQAGGGVIKSVSNVFSMASVSQEANASPQISPRKSAPAGAGGYATTKVSFSFTSDYTSFLRFVDDLEKSLGIINITSVSLKQNPVSTSSKTGKPVVNSGAPLLYQFTMDIETYSLE